MANVNPGPASTANPNLQSPISLERTIQTIAVSMTPVSVTTTTTVEQSFGANGVTQATAATGILPGDVILAVNHPSLTANTFIGGARVDTATSDKFYVVFGSLTTATPASGYWLITVARWNTSGGTSTPQTFSGLPSSLY